MIQVSVYPEKDEPENIVNIKKGIISALLVPVIEEEHNKIMVRFGQYLDLFIYLYCLFEGLCVNFNHVLLWNVMLMFYYCAIIS